MGGSRELGAGPGARSAEAGESARADSNAGAGGRRGDDRKRPASGLLPADYEQAIRGLTFIAANCYAAIGVIDYPERFCSDCDKATGERIRTGTKARLHEYWSMFAGNFPFLKNGHVGALELLAAVVSRWSGARAHLKANRPVFHGQLERIEEDPRIAAVFKRHWP
jgi:GST-like protein